MPASRLVPPGHGALSSPVLHPFLGALQGAGCSVLLLISVAQRCLRLGANHPEAPRQRQEAFSLRAAGAGAGDHA